MIKGCLFDLDGTLLDTLEDLGDSCNQALADFHYPPYEYEDYRYFVGNGVYKLVMRALKQHQEDLDACFERFNHYYDINFTNKTKPYDGIKLLLAHLKEKNIKIGVVTNKPHRYAKKLCDLLFSDTVSVVYGENVSQYPKKPDPTSCFMALEDIGLQKEECLYIGDSNVDIQTAKNAGMISVGVLWGFRTKEELEEEGADYIIDHPLALESIINSINEK